MPRQLETLDNLLARAEHYANYCMRGTGHVTPTLLLVGPDGPLMFVPESLADEDAKDDFATEARLVCIAHAATASVMVLEAWDTAKKENRSVVRPLPRYPGWPFVWSQRTEIKIGDDGRVPIGTHRVRLEVPPRTKVILCHHPSGHRSVLAAQPNPKTKPHLLFSNLPKPNPPA